MCVVGEVPSGRTPGVSARGVEGDNSGGGGGKGARPASFVAGFGRIGAVWWTGEAKCERCLVQRKTTLVGVDGGRAEAGEVW